MPVPPAADVAAHVDDSAFWSEHFRRNRADRLKIPMHGAPALTPTQRECVAVSIAEFELGESSEGKHLLGYARQYAQRTGDEEYARAMAFFIAEENEHARYLRRVMELERMPRVSRTAADSVFRHARKLGGLELSVMVLVTAEIIAQVYYRGLRDATASPALRAVCRRILRDEAHHIRFQCERLAMIRRQRSALTRWRRLRAHETMMLAAIVVVWRNHGPALRLGGFTFTRFRRQVWVKFRRAMAIADPTGYEWPVPALASVS